MKTSTKRLLARACCLPLAAPLALAALSPVAHAGQLNDTGQVTCYNASASTGTVGPATPNPVQSGFEKQDCVRGAAAADALGRMSKVGSSTTKGRDYTRIDNSGNTMPKTDTPGTTGTGANDWGCTRDNVTGLIWEIKTADGGLRDRNSGYTWYDTNTAVNGGAAGTPGIDTTKCSGLTNCNTSAYRDAVNALTGANRVCGATDWRLPTGKELQSLVDYNASGNPAIDLTWFPNTVASYYWSGTAFSRFSDSAWSVYFVGGVLGNDYRDSYRSVRLVRGGP